MAYAVLVALVLLTPSLASAYTAESALAHQLYYCPAEGRADTPEALRRCTLTERPAAQSGQLGNQPQWMRVQIDNPRSITQPGRLIIGPYYLATVEVFSTRDSIQPIGTGGAYAGGARASARIGGHAFAVALDPGRNDFLVRIAAPGVAHLTVRAEAIGGAGAGVDPIAFTIGLHLGMLAILAGLALVPVVLRPGPVSRRLLLLNSVILVQVALGSGTLPTLLPELPGKAAMQAFMILIMLRTAAWGWLYQALISPHYAAPGYRWSCNLSYAAAALAGGLYLIDWLEPARVISLLLVLAIPVIHTIAGLRAQTLMPSLKGALVGSLIVYDVLQIAAIGLLMLASGQSDLPVMISRFLDLAVPLLAIGIVLLRNRASDHQLAATEQALARREAQLAAETHAREEIRTLMDMLTHEIRNPLATLKLATRGLQRPLVDAGASAQQRLDRIGESIGAIDAVIERCDQHSRLETPGIAAQLRRVDINRLLDDLIHRYGLTARVRREGDDLPETDTDPVLLEILLSNLLDNALKYAPAGTPITVTRLAPSVPTPGEGWGIRISNAVEPAMMPDPDRLFERYYRHDHVRREGGSGLGLALSQQMAGLLGGRLTPRLEASCIHFEFRHEGH